MKDCVFCNINNDKIIVQNDLAFAFYDEFPVNKGHMLIIPKRHVANFFDLNQEEYLAINNLVLKCKIMLDALYRPDGYNIGVNVNEAAGQSVFHVHVHLIPRYFGDTPFPKGGVRGVISDKQSY